MILVLNILNRDKGAWLVVKNSQIIFLYDFEINRGEDKSLFHLQKMLDKNKLKLEDFKKFILLVKDASMTQVKIFTTVANTLAWHFDWPIVADYYFEKENADVLDKMINKISKIRKFDAIVPKYSRQAEITLSKKQPKYKITK